jgi:hypothetical protein
MFSCFKTWGDFFYEDVKVMLSEEYKLDIEKYDLFIWLRILVGKAGHDQCKCLSNF